MISNASAGILLRIMKSHSPDAKAQEVQTLFERVFEFSPDGILVTSPEGNVTHANPEVERLFGYSRGELLGKPIEILIPERLRSTHPAHREEYSHESRMRPMGAGLELLGRRRDGSEFPVDIMLSPIHTAEGRMVLAVVRDISEKKHTEDALRLSESQFRSLLESVSDYAIFLLDPNGIISTSNTGEQRLGYKPGDLVGSHFSRLYTRQDIDRGKPQEELRHAAETGRYEDEGWRLRKDGSSFWANTVITAIHDAKGQLRGYAKVTRDFTDRKRVEEALLLQLSNVLLSNLDIRKLLSAISASIQQIVPHDYASVGLYDSETNTLRIHVLDAGQSDSDLTEVTVPVENSPAGAVFSSGEPLLLRHFDKKEFSLTGIRHHLEAHLKSGCWVPLVHDERTLGTLMVGSRHEAAFAEKELQLVAQIAARIAATVDNAVAFKNFAKLSNRLREEKRYLEEELNTEHRFDDIIGSSTGLKRVLKHVETVANSDATVLIQGETGTGKELVARAVHRLSPRSNRTFVKINCAAIPAGLLESELFGHEKGAFTGAISQKIGRLELAHQGTLFLDEIGDLPLELQPKILRALQEKEFERLGSTRTISVDVRLIAATHRNLDKMVAEGQFRSDLYYRLKVFPIAVPSLRDRREDIPLLVSYFVEKHARRMNRLIETIPPETMQAFATWKWPGNVRELENFVERAVILSPGSVLRAPLAELQMPEEPEPATTATLETAEREHILRTLRESRGMISGPNGAAARLGLKRTTLNSKLKKLGIERSDYIS